MKIEDKDVVVSHEDCGIAMREVINYSGQKVTLVRKARKTKVWLATHRVDQEVFDELVRKYAAQRVKEMSDVREDTVSRDNGQVVALFPQQLDNRNND